MARSIFSLFTLMAAMLCGSVTFAAEAGVGQVVKALEAGYASLTDVQADFAQRTSVAGMPREQKGNGVMSIRRVSGAPAMFRFNYAKPAQQLVSDGKTVWFYQPENKQVIVSDLATALQGGSGAGVNYLADLSTVSRDFEARLGGQGRDKKGNYVLELVPKKKSPVMSKLQLTVSGKAVEAVAAGEKPEPFPVVASKVFDLGGGSTLLEFSNVKTNRGTPSSQFTFKVPKGVEVIQNR